MFLALLQDCKYSGGSFMSFGPAGASRSGDGKSIAEDVNDLMRKRHQNNDRPTRRKLGPPYEFASLEVGDIGEIECKRSGCG
jgi:hypothetical protein